MFARRRRPKFVDRSRLCLAAFAIVLGLVGCSAHTTPKSGGPASSEQTTQPVTTSPEVTEPASSDSLSSSDTSSFSGAQDSSSLSPPVLASNAIGRSLTLADVFSSTGNWRDDRFDIANRAGLTGIGTEVTNCDENGAVMLELRLAEGFNTLKMNVGQANTSKSSDQVLITEVVANGKQIDSRHVPFNKIQAFQEPISGVNALRILAYLDPTACSASRTSPSVLAVVQGLTVS